MSNNTGIYKITNPITGRVYIGKAVNINRRFKEYKNIKKSAQQIRLYRSFNKYGIDEHIFEIVESCLVENLSNRERYWQDYYNVLSKKGMNCVLTQSDEKSGSLSEETKRKISNANKGNIHSEETRAKMGLKNLGKKATLETRQKMSEFRKGKKLSEKWKNNISKGNRNKPKSENHKLNLSDSKIGKPNKCLQKKVIDVSTNIIYTSILEVSLKFKINYGTLANWLRNDNINKSNFKLYNHE